MASTVRVQAARIPDRDRLLAALREEGLEAEVVDRAADHLERVGAIIDDTSKQVFDTSFIQRKTEKKRRKPKNLEELLGKVGEEGDFNSKMRESLVSIGRLVLFLANEADGLKWPNSATLHVCSHGLHYASAVFEGERAVGAVVEQRVVERSRPRGLALVNRLKADPTLAATEIRHDQRDDRHERKEVVVKPHRRAREVRHERDLGVQEE